jgi:hypothetical protein
MSWRCGVKPEFERFGFEEACDERIGREIDNLSAFHKIGIGEPSEIVTQMRSVIEAYCTVTYAGFFDPKDNLRSIVEKIRNGGDQHPACALLDELDQIHEYSQNHLDTDKFAESASHPIDLVELRRFVLRTLKIVRAIPNQSSSTLSEN